MLWIIGEISRSHSATVQRSVLTLSQRLTIHHRPSPRLVVLQVFHRASLSFACRVGLLRYRPIPSAAGLPGPDADGKGRQAGDAGDGG